ncbi:hypothetical protein BVRB_1g016450 [Beta vulgaris subsp. vulgaris]|nr:hypothetical protein BVRB_1g016450 [Beta vulgaris subsp. vulgaris]
MGVKLKAITRGNQRKLREYVGLGQGARQGEYKKLVMLDVQLGCNRVWCGFWAW